MPLPCVSSDIAYIPIECFRMTWDSDWWIVRLETPIYTLTPLSSLDPHRPSVASTSKFSVQ